MNYNIVPLNELVNQFSRLPGIGKKTAQRLAYSILEQPPERAKQFAEALVNAREKIHFCKNCQALTDLEVCQICDNPARDHTTVCVVEEPRDVMAFERTREFSGIYHVLHGVISPLDGITPDKLKIKELMTRLASGEIKELIMATNPTVEGEATASYISRLVKPMGIKVTRLAYGIPVGGDLEYADEYTLARALEGRNEI
ncbi:MAG: recombination protein RecR [Clostridia bacterium]|nr:recombination protein RecR [Clostridia bacterium]MBQ2316220.1 recombination protein RecR [Clostridia bacterium]MEE0807888.1 recombination mediator RecR [Acutalibacteraceae bacterium]